MAVLAQPHHDALLTRIDAKAAERHAAENGFARLELTTARTNHAAQSVCESLGWVRDENFFASSRRVGG